MKGNVQHGTTLNAGGLDWAAGALARYPRLVMDMEVFTDHPNKRWEGRRETQGRRERVSRVLRQHMTARGSARQLLWAERVFGQLQTSPEAPTVGWVADGCVLGAVW